MNSFMLGFLDEIEKRGGISDTLKTVKKIDPIDTFQAAVHHPLTQAVGYGALAGEGAHLLAHGGQLGKRLQRAAKTKSGARLGHGMVGAGAGFLAAEGVSALIDLFRKKKPGAGIKEVPVLKIQIEQPLPKMTRGRATARARYHNMMRRSLGFNKAKV